MRRKKREKEKGRESTKEYGSKSSSSSNVVARMSFQQAIVAKDALQGMVFLFRIEGGAAHGDGEEQSFC
ncbi:hypothetical protein C1H46_004806 [Malus baccata]|uniref:Uncharacterized protein n=1 Tax=Malus baccata TaxID=106549 RepID=A0A540NEW3_MALBA|nr:hypothetical protein C1H46_004806 [Malus baccata]